MKQKCFENSQEVNYDLMREDRINKGLDQESTADVLGLSPSTISAWETGDRTPKIVHLIKFAEIMSRDPEEYVEGKALMQLRFHVARTRAIMDYAQL